jgi:tetratricopeptide (TPR) repeat protein
MTMGPMVVAPYRAAHATEWQKLTHTANHKVSIEMESVLLNASGTMTVLLQFIPRGELQRRTAANKFGYKDYLQHLEQFEIDCAEKSSRLEFIDILGWRDKRLVRMPGSNKKSTISPDSVLDRVAALLCPEEEISAPDDSSETQADTATEEYGPNTTISMELRRRIDEAQQLTTVEPGNFNAWVELGNAWYDADMPKQSIEAYDRALALKPDDSNVLNDQGAMYRQAGDSRHALANFEKALAIDPGNLESLYNMGYIYAMDLNRIDRALEIWQRYLTLDNSSETAEQVRLFIEKYEKTPP